LRAQESRLAYPHTAIRKAHRRSRYRGRRVPGGKPREAHGTVHTARKFSPVNSTSPTDGSKWVSEVVEDMDFSATERGNMVYVEADDHDISNREWRDHERFSVTVVVAIPDETNVLVQTDDGDIQASSLSGNTTLRSSDGDILVDAALEGDLDIHTSERDIVVDRLENQRAEIRTSDGDVILRSVRAPLDVASGDGDISLTAPGNIAADVRMDGEDLNIEQSLQLLGRIREHSIQGTLKDGGPTIDLRTGGGSISLRQGN